MIRGTTARFKFKLPFQMDEIDIIKIKFWQTNNSALPITKDKDNCVQTDDPDVFCVVLSAEETLRFSDKYKAKVQIRGMCKDGTTWANRQKLITVYPLEDGLSGDITVPSNEEGFVILDGRPIST